MTGVLMKKRKFVDKTTQRKGYVRLDSEASRQVPPGTGRVILGSPETV